MMCVHDGVEITGRTAGEIGQGQAVRGREEVVCASNREKN